MDSDLLFDSDSMDKAIGQVQQVALVTLTEAVAKALIKQKPKRGTPLVEKHLRPSNSVDPCSRPGPSQQWFTALHSHSCCSLDANRLSLGQSKIKTFRK